MKQYLKIICKLFNCKTKDICDITECSGMTNRAYTFVVKNVKYLIRIPGIGANDLVDRLQEKEVYDIIKGKYGDDVLYLDNDGIKISKFIDNGHNCNKDNWKEVDACMKYLHNFHKQHLKAKHDFNLLEKITEYEKLMGGKSKYIDYEKTAKDVKRCCDWIARLKRPTCLIHVDPNPDNFLITNDNIYLLDWEYAANQDPLLDVAMFAIYSGYDEIKIEKLLDCYCESKKDLYIVFAYCAIAGLLWSNWCEYKEHLGQDFGKYALKQYRYAKKYSKLALYGDVR